MMDLPSPIALLDAFAPESLAPTTLWGVFVRIYGLVFAFAIGMLYRQIIPLAGEDGLFPIKGRLDRIRADYPNVIERIVRYPTLHWFFHSDRALKAMLAVGTVAGLVFTVIGVHSRLGLFIMWTIYLSFSNMMGFMYPWDCLLLESAFLSLFLPVLSVSSLSMPVMPVRLLTFLYRALLFRVLFGFGKFKFIGASTKEFSYLRGFMINQPMPSIFGWSLYQMPLFVHQLGLFVFFLSEMVVPFFYFATGPWRIGAALITMKLMFAIHLSGNFGFFNLLTCILSIPTLDGVDTLFADENLWEMIFTHTYGHMFQHLTLLSLLMLAIFFFPFNSWCTMSFFLWPGLSLPINPVGRLLRFLSPFHIVHAFGVFFPHSSAGVRWIPILEGTDDERIHDLVEKDGLDLTVNGPSTNGIVWKEYEYAFMTTRTNRMPPFCAPWHQRLDQAILYESIGMTPETYLSTLSSGNRMDFNPTHGGSMLSRVASCLLRDNVEVAGLFHKNPFPPSSSSKTPSKKVEAIRISFYMYAPTTFRTLFTTGDWWDRKYVGQHVRMLTRRHVEASLKEFHETGQSLNSCGFIQVREPELGHPEHFIAIIDTPVVRELYSRLDTTLDSNNNKKGRVTDVDATNFTSTPLLTTLPSVTNDDRLLIPIEAKHVDQDFWTIFLTRMQGIIQQVRVPQASLTNDDKKTVSSSQLDFEFHLQPGMWSKILTTSLRSNTSPLYGFNAIQVRRLEKISARLSLLLLKRLLPLFHGPGADEMTTAAQISEVQARRAGGKKGIYCIRPCQRDSCAVKDHLHLPSFFHLYLFTQHVIGHGQAVYERILVEPSLASSYVSTFSVASSLAFQGIFHPEMLAFHASKIRMIIRISFPYQLEQSSILPGFLAIYNNFLVREYRTLEEGALSQVQHLPNVTLPTRYDQYWIVEHDGMTVKNANGLEGYEEDNNNNNNKEEKKTK